MQAEHRIQLGEARGRDRFEFKNNILCFRCIDKKDSVKTKIPFLFSITDISYSGLGISCQYKLHENSVLTFNLKDKMESKELNVEVRWSKYDNGQYRSGVRFLDLTYEDVIFINEIVKKLK